MHRLLIAVLTVGEGVIFLTGCCIIIGSIGLILAILFKSTVIVYCMLSGWFLCGLLVLAAIIKALWNGRRFVEIFDHKEDKKEPAGVSTT